MSNNSIKMIRKRGGCIEDNDSGNVYVGSDANDPSVVVGEANVTITPGKGGSLKTCDSGIDDICSKSMPGWLAALPIPNLPSKVITPQSFPYFNYIVPIATIGIACSVFLKKGVDDGQ